MNVTTAVVLIGFTIVFDLISMRYKADLFSTIGGIVMLSSESLLLAGGNIVMNTAFNPSTNTFYNQLGDSTDYQTFVVLFIVFAVMSFYLTMANRKVA